MTRNELAAILHAYREAVLAACPGLHPEMAQRAAAWGTTPEADLGRELDRYLTQASLPSCAVRVFFKMGMGLVYAGCNRQFAADAGLASPADIVGLDDFDPRISWVGQAAKYRRDDREVMERVKAKVGIIERQSSAAGLIWLETSKVPIKHGHRAIGVFGMYAVIDARTAARRTAERTAER